MNDLVFKTSDKVRLRECASCLHEVTSLNGACEFLVDWPRAKYACHYLSACELMPAAVAAPAGILAERAAE